MSTNNITGDRLHSGYASKEYLSNLDPILDKKRELEAKYTCGNCKHINNCVLGKPVVNTNKICNFFDLT